MEAEVQAHELRAVYGRSYIEFDITVALTREIIDGAVVPEPDIADLKR